MLFDRCCDLSWPPCTELLAAAQGTILKERAKSLCLFSRYICQKLGGKKWPPAASFMFEMLEDNHGVFPMHQKVCFSKSEQWDDFWNKQLVVNTLIVTFLMIKSICVFGALTESVSSFFFFFFFFFYTQVLLFGTKSSLWDHQESLQILCGNESKCFEAWKIWNEMEMRCRPLPYGAHVTEVTAVFLGPHPDKKTVNIRLGWVSAWWALRRKKKKKKSSLDHSLGSSEFWSWQKSY